jgi:hypothetical protein
MRASITSISSLKLDSLASRLSSVSTSLIRFYGRTISKQALLRIRWTTRRTFSKINFGLHLTNLIHRSGLCFVRLGRVPKNLPLHMGLSYEWARVYVLAHSSTFMYLNSERSAPSILRRRVRLLQAPLTQSMWVRPYISNLPLKDERESFMISALHHRMLRLWGP